MSKLKVTVRKKHIEEGLPGSPKRCPIALAIKEMGFPLVSVCTEELLTRARGAKKVVAYNVPTRAARFILNFDSGNKVRPQSFEFERAS